MNEFIDVADYATVEEFDIEWEHNGYDQLPLLGQFDFEMYAVVREDEDDRVPIRELDAPDRELAALLFALAGYLAHDIQEEIPLILIDEFETAYPDTASTVIEHVADRVPYIVVTPPERAADSFQNVANNISSA